MQQDASRRSQGEQPFGPSPAHPYGLTFKLYSVCELRFETAIRYFSREHFLLATTEDMSVQLMRNHSLDRRDAVSERMPNPPHSREVRHHHWEAA
jgi:hypothetical protein